MGISDRISNAAKALFGREAQEQPAGTEFHSSAALADTQTSTVDGDRVRRWDGAQTDRLNRQHWRAAVVGADINEDLYADLLKLRARAVYESFNNPMVSGVIDTHSIDLITPSGPTLKVDSDNEEFNKRLSDAWNEWFKSPDIRGEISGVDLLRRWNWSTWTKGPISAIFTNNDQATSDDLVTLKLQDIDPNRIETPPGMISHKDIMFGIQRDKVGRPKQYFVREEPRQGVWIMDSSNYEPVLADDMLFAFKSFDPDQATGFPRLAPCLDDIGQLRQYDAEVLAAARQLANNAMVLGTTQPELMKRARDAALPTGSVELKRGAATYIKPGYQATAITSTQPASNYTEFRHEKLRNLGRIAHMPLLLVLLSAEQANFSQSRIDVNVFYERGLAADRLWWERMVLNVIMRRFLNELMLVKKSGEFYLPTKPDNFQIAWHWEPLPQANEQDHLKAKMLKRQLGMTSWSQDLAEEGKTTDAQRIIIEKDNEILEELGLSNGQPDGKKSASESPMTNEDEDESQATQQATSGPVPQRNSRVGV